MGRRCPTGRGRRLRPVRDRRSPRSLLHSVKHFSVSRTIVCGRPTIAIDPSSQNSAPSRLPSRRLPDGLVRRSDLRLVSCWSSHPGCVSFLEKRRRTSPRAAPSPEGSPDRAYGTPARCDPGWSAAIPGAVGLSGRTPTDVLPAPWTDVVGLPRDEGVSSYSGSSSDKCGSGDAHRVDNVWYHSSSQPFCDPALTASVSPSKNGPHR